VCVDLTGEPAVAEPSRVLFQRRGQTFMGTVNDVLDGGMYYLEITLKSPLSGLLACCARQ